MSDSPLPPNPDEPRPDGDEPNPWADIIGPCYTTQSIARALGWTGPQVADAAASLHLLELRTEDGVLLYPQFQFWNGAVVDGLPEVLRVLRTGTESRWTWAQWLNTRLPGSDGVDEPSYIERLREGQLDYVLLEAKHDAWSWSS
ncbi:hypothetical protein [Microbacterium aerolatum]|uniref:Uncharacterized protein n=1 Tax=Microbacterium aerolatum TaxID=153731 RepID=A0A511AAG7_9MICO|nr:hypothetical protein [Microbacterium aerolatum]GEK85179.1 hypothetical protein MAE01_03550 [Microbacterium aerolatum]GGB28898.1 hypothetical protein GCM10007198_19260 [Microbacterium aerolatum]